MPKRGVFIKQILCFLPVSSLNNKAPLAKENSCKLELIVFREQGLILTQDYHFFKVLSIPPHCAGITVFSSLIFQKTKVANHGWVGLRK